MAFINFATVLLIAQAGVSTSIGPADPVLQVGIFGYRPDGTISVGAWASDLSKPSSIYMLGNRAVEGVRFRCGMGSGHSDMAKDAHYVWRFSGRVISMDSAEAVIDLEWQRAVELGSPVSAPGGSVHLRLKKGERVLLDSVPPQNTQQCWSAVGFEARYGANPFDERRPRIVNGVPERGNAAAPAAGGFSSSGRTGAPDAVSPGRSTNASGGALHIPADGTYRAELWLVRTAPGHADESFHTVLRFSAASSGAFNFAPVAIQVAQGSANVTVSGSLYVVENGSGTTKVQVNLRRTVTPGPGASFPAGFSTSGTTHALPGPDDVLSFEMPPLQLGQETVPDRLSVRVRLAR